MAKQIDYKVYTRIKTGGPEREKFINTVDGFDIPQRDWTEQVMEALRENRAKKVNDQDGELTYHVKPVIKRIPGHDHIFVDHNKLTD